MAEAVLRSLRDGGLEGEHAPALSLHDSLLSPLGPLAFRHFLTSLASFAASAKSQSVGTVLVAFRRSPASYLRLLQSHALHKRIRILDCYSDPLGWNDAGGAGWPENGSGVAVVRNVKDVDNLLFSIVDLAKELSGEGKERVSVAIDSVSHMLRHASLTSVLRLLSNLRCHEKTSSLFWLIHADLHEPKVVNSFEYISTMIASIEPIVQLPDSAHGNSGSVTSLEENYSKAKFNVRIKKRNGRVKLLYEELLLEQEGSVKFSSVPSISSVVTQSLVPKVQFNLQLSDKERMDRANVVLPFEHQGNGRNIEIYDGRRSLAESQKDHGSTKAGILSEQNILNKSDNHSEKGEIHYFRDSDDEQPDSDEDPDDDLDI